MELFLSYRHTSWPFTQRLVNALNIFIDATIFIDYERIDDPDFEIALLNHLRKSAAILLIVSQETFDPSRIHRDDDWVRREIREALLYEKPIIVVLVDGLLIPADIPADILPVRRLEGIKFYPEYFDAGVTRLVNYIHRVTPIRSALLESDDDTFTAPTPFEVAVEALDQGDYDHALLLLEGMRDDGYESVVPLNEMILEARQKRDLELRRQKARIAYRDIRALARSKITLNRARQAWQAFQSAYPEFDEDVDHLAEELAPLPLLSAPHAEAPLLRVLPTQREIEEMIASGDNPKRHSLDGILDYFIHTPVDVPVPAQSASRPQNSADV